MKRFYKTVSAAPDADGWRIDLDGKPVRTPQKSLLSVPSGLLAENIAAEWAAQKDVIDPKTMPLTRLANTVIDRVLQQRQAVVDEIAAYGGSDLICYRACEPLELVQRQHAVWNPIIDWAEHTLAVRLTVTDGVIHKAQSAETLQALKEIVASCPDWHLAPLHQLVSISGSLVIGLATLSGWMDADAAWAAGYLDELYQNEKWGEDKLAASTRAARLADMRAAVQFVSLLKPG